ncbi:nucleotidyltransferase family protein [Mucilaginibacter sp. RS28]|uniref:Nucleotidyltransferase family protein n=1 Tax=Mucilaginibacter straminoryzae TaxID=2932774 RepID=A0A9X1XBN7_9SPHI|nr:nucleotidyltransferase family protein [Mucilaginibacter straminoryzae]MCJ8211789.1 nucleotidyltransferase family protein [Mucilaginibacter straminoryzae]
MQSIEYYKEIISPVLKRFHIRHAAIFGSVAKNNHTEQSDLDVLIEAENGFTLFDTLELERVLSELTQCKVDIVEYNALKPAIREEVLQTAVDIL